MQFTFNLHVVEIYTHSEKEHFQWPRPLIDSIPSKHHKFKCVFLNASCLVQKIHSWYEFHDQVFIYKYTFPFISPFNKFNESS